MIGGSTIASAMLCVVPSLVVICRAKVFGMELAARAKDVWQGCEAVLLLGEMRFIGKTQKCQVAMYVHVAWGGGFSVVQLLHGDTVPE